MKSLIKVLEDRNLISDSTDMKALECLLKKPTTLYCGFDPTAESLHVGHLIPLIVLKKFKEFGHNPVALIGGATGLVGDPSFKDKERSLNTTENVNDWSDCITKQIKNILGDVQVVNNKTWVSEMDAITLIRDVGKHFSVNKMISRDSVKNRIQRDGSGISFTEFTYQILQALDFQVLNRDIGCNLQIGGSDQWGNIVSGIELTRKMNNSSVHGLTLPLLTKADGTKFGKTESGTIWLDPKKTSPYEFFQFWLRTEDADVVRFTKMLTDYYVTDESIEELKMLLAKTMTTMVHGIDMTDKCVLASHSLFSGLDTANDLLIEVGVPHKKLPEDYSSRSLASVLLEVGAVGKAGHAKDAISKGAVTVNGEVATSCDVFSNGSSFLVKIGKKNFQFLVK